MSISATITELPTALLPQKDSLSTKKMNSLFSWKSVVSYAGAAALFGLSVCVLKQGVGSSIYENGPDSNRTQASNNLSQALALLFNEHHFENTVNSSISSTSTPILNAIRTMYVVKNFNFSTNAESQSIDFYSSLLEGSTVLKVAQSGWKWIENYVGVLPISLSAPTASPLLITHVTKNSTLLSIEPIDNQVTAQEALESEAARDATKQQKELELNAAFENKEWSVVESLLKKGVTFSTPEPIGKTRLISAINQGLPQDLLVQLVSATKETLDTKDHFGETAINLAVQNGLWEVVDALLNYNVTVTAFNLYIGTLLIEAIEKSAPEKLIKRLILIFKDKDNKLLNATNRMNKAAIHLALNKGLWSIAHALLDQEVSSTLVDFSCYTPLMLAIKMAAPQELIQRLILLYKNENKLEVIVAGETLLSYVFRLKSWETLGFLIDHGINISALNLFNQTILIQAIIRGAPDQIIEKIIRRLPEDLLKKLDRYGLTARKWAQNKNRSKVLDLLNEKLGPETFTHNSK